MAIVVMRGGQQSADAERGLGVPTPVLIFMVVLSWLKSGFQKNKPIQTLVERYTQLKAVGYVDEIIPYQTEQDLEDILSMYHIDVRVLGVEYKDRDFTGKSICQKRSIDLYFNKRDHRFSSSDLRKRVCNEN